MALPVLDPAIARALAQGLVIPAHPLALTSERRLDERRQRALTRYYLASGAGGVAVAVHTTQFAIREPSVGLLRPVLELAAETVGEQQRPGGAAAGRPIVRVAGVIGRTAQAVAEASLARDLGYHLALVQLGSFADAPDDVLVAHCERVAEVLPLFGFYLQPAAGGRRLGRDFWRRFAAIPNAMAIKIAPFDRYATLEVIEGVARSGRAGEVALYTGNDDDIVLDLLKRFPAPEAAPEAGRDLRIVGGLLGHWAVWTSRAVAMLERVHGIAASGDPVPPDVLDLAVRTTAANAALFDAANGFAGAIAGVHEVLRRQGLMAGRWCLDTAEDLSPGQAEALDRVVTTWPDLTDDDFVAEHLDEWLA
ncbi:MAG: dihydrodipicolinate synthase family protein [Chloroflexota bacterium]